MAFPGNFRFFGIAEAHKSEPSITGKETIHFFDSVLRGGESSHNMHEFLAVSLPFGQDVLESIFDE